MAHLRKLDIVVVVLVAFLLALFKFLDTRGGGANENLRNFMLGDTEENSSHTLMIDGCDY